MNDFVLRIQNENNTIKDYTTIEKTLEVLSEFSSDLKLKRNIEMFETTLAKKKEELKNMDESKNINYGYKANNSEEIIFQKYPEIFTKEFDIIEFKKTSGHGNTFAIICTNIFEKNELFSKIYKGTFINFIEEMNSAYINTNYYHNVRKSYLNFSHYMELMYFKLLLCCFKKEK